MAGCASGVYFLDLSSGKWTFALLPDPQESENRFNDAKCDQDGRIWAGRSHDPETKAKLLSVTENVSTLSGQVQT